MKLGDKVYVAVEKDNGEIKEILDEINYADSLYLSYPEHYIIYEAYFTITGIHIQEREVIQNEYI